MVHALTITCLHCKYSFELQRRQAEDPRVVHAMTHLHPQISVEEQTEREPMAWVLYDSNLHALQVLFGVGEETIEGGHGAYMQ